MRISNVISELTPAILVAFVIAVLAAFLTFVTVSLLTAKFALGIDFAITVGLVLSTAAGKGVFIGALRMIRSGTSN